jgi:replicative DNA helicase
MTTTADRLPPQNLDAERSVLGSLLRDNDVINAVVLILRVDHFYADAHRKIYESIRHLYDKTLRVDTVILAEELSRRGHIEDIGGFGYLAELWDAAPTAANAEHYARIVQDKALSRRLIHASTEILRDAYDQVVPVREMIAGAEHAIFALSRDAVGSRAITLNEALARAKDCIDARHANPDILGGVPSGFADLDAITCGFQDGELTSIAARPSIGKSSVGIALLRNFIMSGGSALFFSMEQNAKEVAERMIACEGHINTHHLRRTKLMTDEKWSRLIGALKNLSNKKLWIIEDSAITPSHIASLSRQHRLRDGIQLVLIDYLQLIDSDDRRAVSREERVSETARRLKQLAKELSIPVVALAQLNREVENRPGGRPRLADIRESGAIEQHSDMIWLMHNPLGSNNLPQVGPWWDLMIEVAKQRNGMTGEVMLRHHRGEMRFESAVVGDVFPKSP